MRLARKIRKMNGLKGVKVLKQTRLSLIFWFSKSLQIDPKTGFGEPFGGFFARFRALGGGYWLVEDVKNELFHQFSW